MEVNQVNKKVVLDLDKIIELQIKLYCFFNGLSISESEMKCLVELGKVEKVNQTDFCNTLKDEGIFSSSQYGRNLVSKLTKKKLITKNKKEIKLTKNIDIQNNKNIIINLRAIRLENESLQIQKDM